ncbi:MAG: DUF5320 domain-containing protein [Euryarchaeota archaeon]|nr:DUF5320 domain-containing protein [Euryarchaeota archaeon]
MEPIGPERDIEIQYLELQKRMIEEQINFLKRVLEEIERKIRSLKGI